MKSQRYETHMSEHLYFTRQDFCGKKEKLEGKIPLSPWVLPTQAMILVPAKCKWAFINKYFQCLIFRICHAII